MDIYEKNLAALRGKDSALVAKLSAIQLNERYEVFASGHYADANILDTTDNQFMYQNKPLDEIEATYIRLQKEYKLYKVMYIYGAGNGYLIHMLLQNPFHEYIYVFEPDLELLYIALNLTDLSEDIAKGRLIFVDPNNCISSELRGVINGLAIVHLKAYMLELNNPFYEKFIENIKHLNSEIMKLFRYYLVSTGNDAQDELLGLGHYLFNLPTMLKNATLRELEGKKNSDTAIIVATGPSLAKQLPLLQKIKDYVTIIAADASLPVLEKVDIKPDIVTTLERTARTAEFYENTSVEFQEGIVFAITAIVAKELLDAIQAGTLQLSMRPTGWHYSYMGFDDWGYLGLGMSAANMAYELASTMNFKQIIIIGQDLAYGEDGRSHTDNHIFGTDEIKQKKNDEFTLAYGGKGEVRTTKVWKMFLEGYQRTVLQNNEKHDFVTINATEGGARIEGTKELSFAEAVEQYVTQEKKKSLITLEKPTHENYMKNMDQAIKKLQDAIELAVDMRRRTKKLLKLLTNEINKYKKYDIEEIHLHVKRKETRKIVDKIAKVRDTYYNGEFKTFYESLISPLLTHLEYDIAYWSLQKETTTKDIITKEWKMIVLHHEWAYRIYVNLEAIMALLEPGLDRLVDKKENE